MEPIHSSFKAEVYAANQVYSTSQRRHSYTEENKNKPSLSTNATNAFYGRNSF